MLKVLFAGIATFSIAYTLLHVIITLLVERGSRKYLERNAMRLLVRKYPSSCYFTPFAIFFKGNVFRVSLKDLADYWSLLIKNRFHK